MKKKWIISLLVIIGVLGWRGWWGKKSFDLKKEVKITEKISENKGVEEVIKNEVLEPVEEFRERITKKGFGDYITPQNSPISPERFWGYHTGVDVEYADDDKEVEIRSIADGKVLVSRIASGYGGVVVIEHKIKEETVYGIYGHLRPKEMIKVGVEVKMGQRIGVLGLGKSSETDGERKHLHFGLSKTNNIKGYVENKEELVNWVDPMMIIN